MDGWQCQAGLAMSSAGTDDRAAQDTIRAAVFAGPEKVEVQRRPRPVLGSPSEVLVEVEACGICGTDLHIVENPPGHPATTGVVLGHEMVGRIVEAGAAAPGADVGTRVVVSPNVACHHCRSCRQGIVSACENFSSIGIFRDGGLADVVSVPAAACYAIGEDIPARTAALTEPLSCVLNGVSQARPMPGDVAVIYGAGAIGLLFLAVLVAGGVRCVVVEPSPSRRETAAKMGATGAIDPATAEVSSALHRIAPDGADVAVDAVGTRLGEAIRDTRPRGKILLFGFNTRARPEIFQSEITRRELVVFGTWVGDFTFPLAVRLQESGLLNLDPIVSHWLPLERTPEAFAALMTGAAVKAVLQVSAPAAH
jgi:threonine dehydrogenase-like Zn-dependent dehydrogenase